MDVETAYLNTEIQVQVYMKMSDYKDLYVKEILVKESKSEDFTMYSKAKYIKS